MKKLIIFAMITCLLAGCTPEKNTTTVEETLAKETTTEIATEKTTEQAERETVIVEVEKEVLVETEKEVIVEVEKEVVVEVEKEVFIEKPVEKEVVQYQTIVVDNTVTMPEKSQGSYLATVAGQYSQVAYLGRECKLETNCANPVWSTLTPDICNVSADGYIFAKKQGLAIVSDGQNKITIACTNSADGKDPYSWETDLYDNSYWDGGQYSYELWQSKVNSITDYFRFVWEQGFEYGDISMQCTTKWVGYGDPRTVLETRKGVCAEAAALACGLLQYDYEDVGVINVSAYGYGHAYSYVYEDGFYYVFDATPLFSRGVGEQDIEIKKFATIDEIKTYVVDYYNRHVMEQDEINNTGIAIYMVSSEHVGCAPPTYSSFHTEDWGAAFAKGYASNGVEEGFDVVVLWSNPKIQYEFQFIPSRQVKEDGCRTFFLFGNDKF